MIKEYMFLLCFTTGTAHRIEIPEGRHIFGEKITEFIKDNGFNPLQCKHMITAHKSLLKRTLNN